MVDLHCHILPGVDDGAVDLADTLDMARAAVEQGCRAVVATSHLWEGMFGTSPELLEDEYPATVEAIRNEGIPLEVFSGAENHFLGGDPERFAEIAVPIGEAARYVLLDFAMGDVPPGMSEMIAALADRKRCAVIAHPERNRSLQADPAPIADWIAGGAVIQVNAPSLLGIHGDSAKACAEYLLEQGAAHALASDAHDLKRRPFCLQRGRTRAAELVGEEGAARLTEETPWRIARGEDLEISVPQLVPRSGARRLLRKILDRRGG
jgi:protein-tyrosine phosphatase